MFHVKHDSDIRVLLVESLDSLDIQLSEPELEAIVAYFVMLLDKNEHLNLISSKQDLPTKVAVHLVDSLSLLRWADLPVEAQSMDIGSGGGLPAIPLSIVRPDWNYDLIESTGKKISFLSEVKSQLNLENFSLINKYLNPNINEDNKYYNLITARAVSGLDKLISIAGPRLADGGYFISYKGPQAEIELIEAKKSLKKWKMDLAYALELKLPLIDVDRVILIFSKKA